MVGAQRPTQFSPIVFHDIFNNRIHYVVPQNDDTIIKLFINGSTTDVNGTVLQCNDASNPDSASLEETTLIIYGKFLVRGNYNKAID